MPRLNLDEIYTPEDTGTKVKLYDMGGALLNIRNFPGPWDGSADASQSIRDAIVFCQEKGVGLYADTAVIARIDSYVNFWNLHRIEFDGQITVNFTGGPAVICGYNSEARSNSQYYFRRIQSSVGSTHIPADPLLRLQGLKDAHVRVGYCPYIQMYADSSTDTSKAIAYSHFHFYDCLRLDLWGEPGTSWINGNKFSGRWDQININADTYRHNENLFDCTGSDSPNITITRGADNWFMHIRAEYNTSSIYCGTDTWRNRFEIDRLSNPEHVTPSHITFEDHGVDNVLFTGYDTDFAQETIFEIDNDSLIFRDDTNETGEFAFLRNIFPGVVTPITGDAWEASAHFEGPTVYTKRFRFESNINWQVRVHLFDAAGNLTTGIHTNGKSWVQHAEGWWFNGVPDDNSDFRITNAAVVRIKVEFVVHADTTILTPFTHLRLIAYMPRNKPKARHEMWEYRKFAEGRHRLYLPNIPERGVGPEGTSVETDGGTVTMVDRVDTTLTADATAGAMSISVDSTSIVNDSVIGIHLDDGTPHWAKVKSGGGTNTLQLSSALPSLATAGNAAKAGRWQGHESQELVQERAGTLREIAEATATTFLTFTVALPTTAQGAQASVRFLYSAQVLRTTSTRGVHTTTGEALVSIGRWNEAGSNSAVVTVTKIGSEVVASGGAAIGGTVTLSAVVTGPSNGEQTVEIQAAISTANVAGIRRTFQWDARALIDGRGDEQISLA